MNELNLSLQPFEKEAIRRAAAAGFYPALVQRDVDWFQVLAWSERVQAPGFAWKPATRGEVDPILVGAGRDGRTAIHSGQHRILGGLMGGKPVPKELQETIGVLDPTREWDAQPTFDTADLLALLK